MATDKQDNEEKKSIEETIDKKEPKETGKSAGSEDPVKGRSRPKEQKVDLAKLNKTNVTQAPSVQSIEKTITTSKAAAPKVKSIADTVRNKPAAEKGPPTDWKFAIFACLGSMFLALASHIFGINGGLVYNDRYNLAYLMSQKIMGRTSENVIAEIMGVGPLKQPWLKASFIADKGEYGSDFIWYHTVNVFWHALSTGLLFFIVLTVARHLHHRNRLKLNPHHIAGATAILFACHPVTCESVTYLSARSSVLGTQNYFLTLFFGLLGLLVKHPVWRVIFILVSLATGAMALWTNPETVSLPAMALFTLFIIKRPLSQWKDTIKDHPVLSGLGLVLTLGVPFLLLLGAQYCTANNLFLPTLTPLAYYASQLKGFVFYYLRVFLVPFGLSVDPPLAIASGFTDPFAIAAVAIILGASGYLLAKVKQPILGFASMLILCGLIPHAFMIQPDTVADWVAYMPLSGAMIFAAYGIATLASHRFHRAVALMVTVGLTFTVLTVFRDLQWASTFKIWESALTLRPKSGLGHAMMSMEYVKRNEIDAAEKEAKLATSYGPDLVVTRLSRAKIELQKKNFEQADAMLKSTLLLAEQQHLAPAVKSEIQLTQLQSLIGQRNQKDANLLLTKLITELDEDPKIIYLVAEADFQQQRFDKAVYEYQKALQADPSLIEAFEPMIKCALMMRSAQDAYNIAVKYNDTVGGPNAKLLLARAAILSKNETEAEDVLKAMLVEDPKNARAIYLLSRLYKRQNKKDEWNKYREAAIKTDPEIAIKYDVPELDLDEMMGAAGKGQVPAPVEDAYPQPLPPDSMPAPEPITPAPAATPATKTDNSASPPATPTKTDSAASPKAEIPAPTKASTPNSPAQPEAPTH